MAEPIIVQIVGTPVACADGVEDRWRETALWARGRLRSRFGDAVQVDYYDLFDLACPPLPQGAQLPLVLIRGDVVSSGGKLSLPLIRKRLESILAREAAE